MSPRKTILELGVCGNGHPITEDNVKRHRRYGKDGRGGKGWVLQCIECKKKDREKFYAKRRQQMEDRGALEWWKVCAASMTCGHTLEFRSPWPKKNDLIWCGRCREYRLVTHLQLVRTITEGSGDVATCPSE